MTVATTADHTNDHHSDHDSYHHMWPWLTITVNTTTDHHSDYGSDQLQLTTSRIISVHYDQHHREYYHNDHHNDYYDLPGNITTDHQSAHDYYHYGWQIKWTQLISTVTTK